MIKIANYLCVFLIRSPDATEQFVKKIFKYKKKPKLAFFELEFFSSSKN